MPRKKSRLPRAGTRQRAIPQTQLNFGTNIRTTSHFNKRWEVLSERQKRCAEQKIRFLAANPRHPSLKIHSHHRTGEMEAYLSVTMRLLFDYGKGGELCLFDVGGHSIVDRAHQRRFS